MTETALLEVVKLGGGYALAAVVMWMYRVDALKKVSSAEEAALVQGEHAKTMLAYGDKMATAITVIAESSRAQTEILHRIEAAANRSAACPMTGLTGEMVRDASVATRRAIADGLSRSE